MPYVNTTLTIPENVTTVLNKAVEMSFVPTQIFAQVANQKESENSDGAVQGDTVRFTIYNSMNPATDDLDEVNDPNGDSISNSQKDIKLVEKGNLVSVSRKLRLTSFDNLDLTVPMLVGQNMGESTDLYARKVMDLQVGSDYVTYVGQTSKSAITASNKLTADIVRDTKLLLQRNNVPKDPRFGAYIFICAPDVINDLKKETGENSWTGISKYADPGSVMRGEIGMFDEFRFIQTTNVRSDYAGGVAVQSTTVNGAHSANATNITVTSATGFAIGDIIVITVGSNKYAHKIVNIAGAVITISKCFNKNGTVFRASKTQVGLIEALAGSEVFKKGVQVFTSYAMGFQALGYAHAQTPVMTITKKSGGLERSVDVGWYALHAYGELRPEALQKVFSAASKGANT